MPANTAANEFAGDFLGLKNKARPYTICVSALPHPIPTEDLGEESVTAVSGGESVTNDNLAVNRSCVVLVFTTQTNDQSKGWVDSIRNTILKFSKQGSLTKGGHNDPSSTPALTMSKKEYTDWQHHLVGLCNDASSLFGAQVCTLQPRQWKHLVKDDGTGIEVPYPDCYYAHGAHLDASKWSDNSIHSGLEASRISGPNGEYMSTVSPNQTEVIKCSAPGPSVRCSLDAELDLYTG
jgi:hypothetical protein